jgi:hypothetical protein
MCQFLHFILRCRTRSRALAAGEPDHVGVEVGPGERFSPHGEVGDNAVGNLSTSDGDGFQTTLYLPTRLTADVNSDTSSTEGFKSAASSSFTAYPGTAEPVAPGNSYAEAPLQMEQSRPPSAQGMPALFDRELGIDFGQLNNEELTRAMWSTPTAPTVGPTATSPSVTGHFEEGGLQWGSQEWQMYGQRLAEQTRSFWSNTGGS